jgi:hypothetical protein
MYATGRKADVAGLEMDASVIDVSMVCSVFTSVTLSARRPMLDRFGLARIVQSVTSPAIASRGTLQRLRPRRRRSSKPAYDIIFQPTTSCGNLTVRSDGRYT